VKLKSPRTGVFYVGGGTPKNYISQVEVIQEVMGYPENPHMYAAQITVDVPQWGGLSGCTFEESQSWGKFHKDAKMAQSLVDATIGLPLLIGYLMQKGVHKKRKQKKYRWKGEELVDLT
jgi:deoxyhypusine synthase